MAELCFNTFNRSAYFGVEPDLAEQVKAAGAAGFPWFGPDIFSLDVWIGAGRGVDELAAMLRDHGMACWEIAALNIEERTTTLTNARHLADLARVLEPRWILTNVGAPIDAALLATFDEVCDVLADAGTKPAIEYLPFTPAFDIATAQQLVDHVGRDRARILFDTWHHFRGPDTYDELEAAPLDLVAYIQFDDALPMVGDDLVEETIHRRVFPGEGEFDLDGYCARMRAKGFDGVVSVEILSAEWRDRDVHEFARRAFDASLRYWPAHS
jgi:sugar phosphate isomerase/epimerase